LLKYKEMEKLSLEKIRDLKIQANEIRKSIVSMISEAGSGHTGGSLGMTDIFTLLYFSVLKHKPENPEWKDRDRLVLSNGHICPVLYATLSYAGYFPKDELLTLRKWGSRLQGHPHREFLPILETSSGPLGEGLSQAVGMALASKIDSKSELDKQIYCLVGDGELNEGENWEAIMLAYKYKLDNLILIVDRNKIQLDGNTEDIMPLDSLHFKFDAFNWHVQTVDGHDFEQINNAIINAKNMEGKPSVIIAHTTPCKGVKAWEGDYRWHGKAPNKEEAKMALEELDKLIN